MSVTVGLSSLLLVPPLSTRRQDSRPFQPSGEEFRRPLDCLGFGTKTTSDAKPPLPLFLKLPKSKRLFSPLSFLFYRSAVFCCRSLRIGRSACICANQRTAPFCTRLLPPRSWRGTNDPRPSVARLQGLACLLLREALLLAQRRAAPSPPPPLPSQEPRAAPQSCELRWCSRPRSARLGFDWTFTAWGWFLAPGIDRPPGRQALRVGLEP